MTTATDTRTHCMHVRLVQDEQHHYDLLSNSPKTKLSGRNSCPNGPERTESMVPGSRSTRIARGTNLLPLGEKEQKMGGKREVTGRMVEEDIDSLRVGEVRSFVVNYGKYSFCLSNENDLE